jgi:PKD repeat protein
MAIIYVKSGATGVADGTSWTDAFTTLTAALSAASGGDEIWVTRDTYYPGNSANDKFFFNGTSIALYGGFIGYENSISERNTNKNKTILDGQGINYHVMQIDSILILDGFIIQRGNANGATSDDKTGAALYTYKNLTITNCEFRYNNALGNGGAVSSTNIATKNFIKCSFHDNIAGVRGGAVAIYGNTSTFSECLFFNNTSSLEGGAISFSGSGVGNGLSYYHNCLFYNNSSSTDYNDIYNNNDTTYVYNSIVYNGGATRTIRNGEFRYSLVENSGGSTSWDGAYGTDNGGNIDTDPLFWNPSLFDFHLRPDSSCIDAGDGDYAQSTDLEGNNRVDTATTTTGTGTIDYTDIGPYEFQLSKKRRFWVLLDSGYTSTNHLGTREDPYSLENLTYHTLQEGDVFYLRGIRSGYTSDVIYDLTGTNYEVRAWDINEYGPWRLTTTQNFGGTGAVFYDGFLSSEKLYLGGSKRMFISATAGAGDDIYIGNHENTVFSIYGDGTLPSGNNANISRCLFVKGGSSTITIDSGATLTIDNCILEYTNQADAFTVNGTLNNTNLTYAWSAPSLPSFSTTDLTDFSMDGGSSPSTVSDTAGPGYGDSWANGLRIFVNFSQSSTGNSGYYGTEYIGWNEFTSLLSSTSQSLVFYCRGSKTLSSNISESTKTVTIRDWDVMKYGPWRINGSSSYNVDLSSATLKYGVFEVNYAKFKQADFMYIRYYEESINSAIEIPASGSSQLTYSTIISNTDIDINGSNAILDISNCIIYFKDNFDFFENDVSQTINLTDSITNATSLSNLFITTTGVTDSNITYSWSAPSFPDWDTTNLSNFSLMGSPDASEYGVKNFPTILYFNIATTNDGLDNDGSDPSNPGSFYKFFDNAPNKWNRVTAYIKGYRDITSESENDFNILQEQRSTKDNYIQGWELSTNGPWAIKANEVELSGISMRDGIVYCDGDTKLAGYRLGSVTDITTYTNMFFYTLGRITVDSGNTKFQACTKISNGNPIAFYEGKPNNIFGYNSYISDNFVDGEYLGWWNEEFTGPDADEWDLTQYPPGSNKWVAVQNGSVDTRLTPDGLLLTGDFDFTVEFVYGSSNSDNVSCKLMLLNSGGTQEAEISINGTQIRFLNGFTETHSTTFEAYKSIYIRMVRKNNTIYAYYSEEEPIEWTAFSNTISYSSDYYLNVEGATRHGIGLLDLKSEGIAGTDGLAYGVKSLDLEYIDTAIDSDAVEEGAWDYNTIALQDIVNKIAVWSGPNISYSGSNQSTWTTPTWPTWFDVEADDKKAFGFSILGSNITIPGSGSYTDYPTGLWGITRTNVGAFYFGTAFDFEGNPTLVYFSPSSPGSVQFSALYDTGATSWRWYFGDGDDYYTTDPLFKDPTHEYISEGVFTVSLELNDDPSNRLTKIGYIISLRILTLSIIADPKFYLGTIPGGGVPVDFGVTNPTRTLDPTPVGSYPGFKWDYDDGSPIVTGVTGPSHNFSAYGSYSVELTLRDIGISGIDSTKQLTAFNTEVQIYNIIINVSPTLGKKPLIVNFTSTPAPGSSILTYKWDFRDGSISSTQNAIHQYITEGTYDTALIIDEGLISQQIFSSDASYPGVDVVIPGMQVIVSNIEADFTINPIHGYVPLTGLFEDNSAGNLTGWQWDFDDGSPQVLGETGIYHVYDSAATYNPTLTVYDIYGLTDTASNQIIAIDYLDISISNTSPVVISSVTFSPINDTYATDWKWDLIYIDPILGDIIISRKTTSVIENKNYVKSITVPGNYKIKLTITDDLSNEYSSTKTFTATENINLITDPSPATGQPPFLVDFSTTGLDFSSLSSFGWDFDGNGIIDNTTDQTPNNSYTMVGSFAPSLTINWFLQDIDNPALNTEVTVLKSTTVTVGQEDLVISITANPSQGHKPLTSTLNGNSNNPVSTWLWEVKTTSTSYIEIGNSQQLTYTFNGAGIYSVRLTVTDVYGDTDTATKSIIVVNDFSTPDIATPSNQLLEITGSGQLQIYIGGRGVLFKIPPDQDDPNPYGFRRSSGSTQIYD